MTLTNQEQMEFKQDYIDKLKAKSKKVFLTTSENQRHDLWAVNHFGDVTYAFMFEVLIVNVTYAMSKGYLVADND